MKIELTASQESLVTEFPPIKGSGGKDYYYIPFYFVKIGEGRTYELLEFDQLPKGIQLHIKNKEK